MMTKCSASFWTQSDNYVLMIDASTPLTARATGLQKGMQQANMMQTLHESSPELRLYHWRQLLSGFHLNRPVSILG
jgi:hypothetical protein